MGIVACPSNENIWGGAKTAASVKADMSGNLLFYLYLLFSVPSS